MVNTHKVNRILRDLEVYLEDLDEIVPESKEELSKNKEKEYSSAFLLEQVVNECINLGNHVISSRNLDVPESFKQVFDELSEAGIITSETSEHMMEFVEIRNILAHRYGKFPVDELWEGINKRKRINKFIEQVCESLG